MNQTLSFPLIHRQGFHWPVTKTCRSVSSWNIPLARRLQLNRQTLTLCMFWFLSSRQPLLHNITFLDTCQKTVSTHSPQFQSNLSIAPKLSLIMIANVRIDLCPLRKRNIKFPFCPMNQDYKYLSLLLRQQFPYSISLPPLLLKNTSAPPPFSELQSKHPYGLKTRTQEPSTSTMASISKIPEVHPPFSISSPQLFSDFSPASLISAFLFPES